MPLDVIYEIPLCHQLSGGGGFQQDEGVADNGCFGGEAPVGGGGGCCELVAVAMELKRWSFVPARRDSCKWKRLNGIARRWSFDEARAVGCELWV